jgi:hypothetical protein
MSFTSNLEIMLSCTVFLRFGKTVCDTNFLNHKNASRHQRKLKCPPLHTVFLSSQGSVPDGRFLSGDPSFCVLHSVPEVPHA